MVSSNRRSIGSRFPRHPHYLAVAIFPEVRQFPISRLKRRRLRRQYPPGPSSGQGKTAVRGRPIGGPDGLACIVCDTGKCINGVSNSSFLTVMGLRRRSSKVAGPYALWSVIHLVTFPHHSWASEFLASLWAPHQLRCTIYWSIMARLWTSSSTRSRGRGWTRRQEGFSDG